MDNEILIALERAQRLAKSKSRIVGIPRPGQYPFAVNRRALKVLLGDAPADTVIALSDRLDIRMPSARRWYSLKDAFRQQAGRAERIKACRMSWLASRRGRDRRVPAHLSAALRKAEKALKRWDKPRPTKCLFHWLHAADREAGVPIEARAEILNWYRQKPLRRALAKQAAKLIASDNAWSSLAFAPLYSWARKGHWNLTRYSQIPSQRRIDPSYYLKRLPQYTPLLMGHRPYSLSDRFIPVARSEVVAYLENRAQWENLRLEAKGLRAQISQLTSGE